MAIENQSSSQNDENYVYMYRDSTGNIIYIGTGRHSDRSLSHTGERAHNETLTAFLNSSNSFFIEIAGPFASSEITAIVEAALISALSATPNVEKHLRNKVDGHHHGLFRPIGVPVQFASRASEAPLDEQELKRCVNGEPVLLVYVGKKHLDDDREPIDLARPPSEAAIQERIVKWWQLDRYMEAWRETPKCIPAMLVAVSGTPKHRVVVGSLQIDQDPEKLPWTRSEKNRLSEVPVRGHQSLDFGEIRGRRLEPDLVKFGGVRAQFFKII